MKKISVRSEKRKSWRFPVPNLRQDGELRFGDICLPVRVLDQSASGFAAMAWQACDVDIGSTGLLRAGEDWFEIRLINCMPMEPPESEEDSEPDDQMQCFRLGLYRLADIIDPDEKQAGWLWPVFRVQYGNVMPGNSTTLGFGVLFVLVVVVLPVIAILILQSFSGNKVGDSTGLTKSIAATERYGKTEPDWERLSSTTQSKATSIINPNINAASLGRLANYTEDLISIIRGNPGASVFMVPEVIHKLGITEEQKHQLQQIVDATTDVVDELETQLNGTISSEEYQKLLSTARNSALQLLTDDQRTKWQILSDEKTPNKNVPKIKNDK